MRTAESTGALGEDLAAAYLEGRGMRVIARNYRCRQGEIDLIAWEGETLCFVEVKARSNWEMALPREYVTAGKREKLRAAAALYLAEQGLDCPVRFDVAEVYLKAGRKAGIHYIKNAF